MSATASLTTTLKPLEPWLFDTQVAEISVNRPNEVWVDKGQGCERFDVAFSLGQMERLAQLAASYSQQALTKHHPLLAATLPLGYRLQCAISPVTYCYNAKGVAQDTVALSIRKQTTANLTLADFTHQGGFAINQHTLTPQDALHQLRQLHQQGDYPRLLQCAMAWHKTLLISGGTFSGKTTLLNMLLREIEPHERIITIEDTPELQVPHANQVRLFFPRGQHSVANVTASDLVTASLRLRPDRIIMGELRADDAVHWLAAANSGHAGTLSTLHADTPALALTKLADSIKASRPTQSDASILRYITQVVDIIVQIKRTSTTNKRQVTDIVFTEDLV